MLPAAAARARPRWPVARARVPPWAGAARRSGPAGRPAASRLRAPPNPGWSTLNPPRQVSPKEGRASTTELEKKRQKFSTGSSGAVAALELLARAAPARVVATDVLVVRLDDRPRRCRD